MSWLCAHSPLAFVKAEGVLIPVTAVVDVDISAIEQGRVVVRYRRGARVVRVVAQGLDAIQAVMLLKPSALEGLRLAWPRLAWVFHNVVAHPLVGILDMLAYPLRWVGWHRPVVRLAIWLHDVTTPCPRGVRKRCEGAKVTEVRRG